MRKTNSVIVVTVLMLGNLTISLQAIPLDFVREEKTLSQSESAEMRISRLLQERGLEPAAADAKARKLFRSDARCAAAGIKHLGERLGERLPAPVLDDALARRALFEKSVDLASADSLAALVHEASGVAPDEQTLNLLHDVAAVNKAFSA
jgi:hypothetical protein